MPICRGLTARRFRPMKRLSPQSYICIPKQKRPQDTFPRPREKQAVVEVVVTVVVVSAAAVVVDEKI